MAIVDNKGVFTPLAKPPITFKQEKENDGMGEQRTRKRRSEGSDWQDKMDPKETRQEGGITGIGGKHVEETYNTY